MTSHEVVDLLDDSDEEVPLLVIQKAVSVVKCPSSGPVKNPDKNSCIDLCGDDSDEGAPRVTAKASLVARKQHSPAQQRPLSSSAHATASRRKLRAATTKSRGSPARHNLSYDIDDSEDEIPTESVFAKKRQSPSAVPRTASSTTKNVQPKRFVSSKSSSSKAAGTSFDCAPQPETIAIDLSESDDENTSTTNMVTTGKISKVSIDSTRRRALNSCKQTSPQVAKRTLSNDDGQPGQPKTTKRKLTASTSTARTIENIPGDGSDSDLEILSGPTFSKNAGVTSASQRDAYESPRPSSALKAAPKPSPTVRSAVSLRNSSYASFTYPTLLTNSRQYDDLRAKLALAFWKAARPLTDRAHERQRVDQFGKKVVRLALSRHPIRSLEEFLFSFLKGAVAAAPQSKADLKRHLENGGYGQTETPRSRYGQGFYTITEACLVVLYEHVQRQIRDDTLDVSEVLKEKDSWLSLDAMIPLIDARLRPECPAKLTRADCDDYGAAHYLEASTRSVEFLQVSKLECELGDECGPRIKRHRRQGKVCFELLEVGYVDAEYIRGRLFPSGKGHYRTSQISGKVKAGFEQICLGVDRQEGGGGGKALHEMCGKLDIYKVPYFVGTLAIGDYVFFTSGKKNELDYLCPIIVERKSVQDVAMSIHDGRWTAQKSRMYKGQYIFGYNKCKMVYIIEGNANGQVVTGGFIGNRRHNVDKERLQEELDKLKLEGFEVITTSSRQNTMCELSRWAKKIATEIRDGTLKAEYTYQQFKDELKKIPADTDFSRIAKYHAAQNTAEYEDEVTKIDENSNLMVSKSEPAEQTREVDQPMAKKPKVMDDDELSNAPISRLKELCKSVGLAMTGNRSALIARYRGPHPPKVWLTRKNRKQHVPSSYNVGGTALLVALYLHEKETGGLDKGLLKDELYVLAEGMNITKNPFSGGTTQTGPYLYDGWSNMKHLLNGDPALVTMSKKRYKLTRSCNLAGFDVAEAMHKWCHQHDNCPCGQEI